MFAGRRSIVHVMFMVNLFHFFSMTFYCPKCHSYRPCCILPVLSQEYVYVVSVVVVVSCCTLMKWGLCVVVFLSFFVCTRSKMGLEYLCASLVNSMFTLYMRFLKIH